MLPFLQAVSLVLITGLITDLDVNTHIGRRGQINSHAVPSPCSASPDSKEEWGKESNVRPAIV